ncbi:putative uncharacterized protein C8orf89 homolog isoform X4 [Sarcophilus harrisii]|uniref:putative uncharacterized protein C8orf89 homolog isoform X4 n=1 Tax=Sarcophilus harrisii TaxID=9305 RepID=UPI001301A607|nr:putative uncharacterized protein C8orf89 homolog isoform X4 [Sarcophilus harrisii]
MATLGMATVTVCTPLAAGTQLPARVTRPGPAGDGAGMRRSDRPLWSSGDGKTGRVYCNIMLQILKAHFADDELRQTGLLADLPRITHKKNISSFSKEQNRMPVLTPENRYLTSRVTKSSLDGCFLFEKSWKKAALETQKMKKEYSSIFGLKDFKEVDTIPSLPEVQTYRTNTETPLDVLKRHPCAALKTSKIRLPTEKNSRNEISRLELWERRVREEESSLNEDMPTCLPSFSLPQKPRQQSVKEENLKNRSMKSYQTSSLLSLQEKTKGFSFRSPLTGASPEYLQRLSELAILEYDTIRQETGKKLKKVKKRELSDC